MAVSQIKIGTNEVQDIHAIQLKTSRSIDGVNFNGTTAITHYGTCSTAAATAAKVVTLANFVLVTGSRIAVKFTVTNSAASPTLNVNNTGAKPIFYNNAAITASYLVANRVYEFIFDGTNYVMVGEKDTNTTYGVVSTSANGLTPKITNTTGFLRGDGTWSVPADTKVNMVQRGTTKSYLLGTTVAPTSSAQGITSVAETGVYFDTTAATLVAKTFKGALQGNASTASKWSAARTITVSGNASGSVSIDGSADATLSLTVSKATSATNIDDGTF